MATVKVCDRCGTQAAEDNTRRWIDVVVAFPHRDAEDPNKVIELCPDCHKQLRQFLANKSAGFDDLCG